MEHIDNKDIDKKTNLYVSRYYASISNKKRHRLNRFKKIFNKSLEKITYNILDFYEIDRDIENYNTIYNFLIDILDINQLLIYLDSIFIDNNK